MTDSFLPSQQLDLIYDESFPVEETKRLRISLHMIVKRHLPPDATAWSHDKILESLNKITHLRLDREKIGLIDNLELLGTRLNNLYLQQNKIERIENLDCLTNLRFLTLAANRIRTIEGLVHLPNLGFLDLSDNVIKSFDIDELPQSLVILNLKGNPCALSADHRGRIIQDLGNLRELDGKDVTREERVEAGYTVSGDSDSDDQQPEDKHFSSKHRQPSSKNIRESLTDTSTAILLRSQDRLEMSLEKHHQKLHWLEDFRGDVSSVASSARTDMG